MNAGSLLFWGAKVSIALSLISPKKVPGKITNMIRDLSEKNNPEYEWIDITAPQEEELYKIAAKYNLHEASVRDCLQSGHLPKYERFKGYTFIILRVYYPAAENEEEADTVQELTNKIAIFIADHFIITIHRNEWTPIDYISNEYVCGGDCKHPTHVLNEIVKAGLHSYDRPIVQLTNAIEFYETQVFLKNRNVSLIKGLYFVKRKLDVIKRLLLLTHDIIDKIDPKETSNAYSRDCRDLYIKQQSLFDSLSEQTNNLLNIYFNISSQRTNETMRVLTIFSVFFMPLTFIVGVYGMNFKFMPELEWRYGYPTAIGAMVLVTVLVYIWFKKKKWM